MAQPTSVPLVDWRARLENKRSVLGDPWIQTRSIRSTSPPSFLGSSHPRTFSSHCPTSRSNAQLLRHPQASPRTSELRFATTHATRRLLPTVRGGAPAPERHPYTTCGIHQ